MSSIGGVNASASQFFVEASTNLQNTVAPIQEATSALNQNSYDNTGKTADFLSQFRNKLQSFQHNLTSNSFLSNGFSWRVKTAGVSDREKLLVYAATEAEEKEYSVDIDRLANNRKALSEQLDSNEVTEFEEGTYSFDLTVGDATYSLDVEIDQTVTDPDTNKDVLRKIQSAIDGKDDNIEAFITDTKVKDFTLYSDNFFYKDVSTLTIRNPSTGTENAFSLQDTSGDLIETLGLDVVRKVGNANEYSVNASSSSTQSNSVAINSDLQAQFLDITPEKITSVRVRDDRSDLEKELTDTIDEYNDFIQWLDDNQRFVSTRAKNDIFQEIGSTLLNQNSPQSKNGAVSQGDISSALQINNKNTIEYDLSEIGLQLTNEGRLEIDGDFGTALENDLKAVYDVLAGEEGFFSKVGTAVNDILEEGGANYILKQSNFLTYDTSAKTTDVYLQGASQVISVFA